MIKVNKKSLKKHGYVEYKMDKFQKCVKDTMGKRYFINIEYYSLAVDNIPKSLLKGYTCEFQFQNMEMYRAKSDLCPNFSMEIKNQDLLEIEHYIKTLWIVSKCPYYERF